MQHFPPRGGSRSRGWKGGNLLGWFVVETQGSPPPTPNPIGEGRVHIPSARGVWALLCAYNQGAEGPGPGPCSPPERSSQCRPWLPPRPWLCERGLHDHPRGSPPLVLLRPSAWRPFLPPSTHFSSLILFASSTASSWKSAPCPSPEPLGPALALCCQCLSPSLDWGPFEDRLHLIHLPGTAGCELGLQWGKVSLEGRTAWVKAWGSSPAFTEHHCVLGVVLVLYRVHCFHPHSGPKSRVGCCFHSQKWKLSLQCEDRRCVQSCC